MNETPEMFVSAIDYTVKVPPGKYWLGDPCYSVPNDLWGPLLDSCETFNLPIGAVTKDGQGYKVLAFGTAHGDGVYRDQFDNSFPVDAGLIGLTPVGLADGEPFGSTLVEFKKDTECSCYEGILQFGRHTIDTKED